MPRLFCSIAEIVDCLEINLKKSEKTFDMAGSSAIVKSRQIIHQEAEEMKDLRSAQIAASKVESKYARIGKLPWNEVYSSEKEIVADLAKVHVPENGEWGGAASLLYTGYEYIHSFARRVQNGSYLTEAQMRQAKRLAKEIKKAVAVAEFY